MQTKRTGQSEWQKAQGRFVDIPFGDGPEETTYLVAEAIEQHDRGRVDDLIQPTIDQNVEWCRRTTAFPETISATEFQQILRHTYPLHPLTLRVLPYLFRRFGQNERSLFAFLSSNEPHGFQEFISDSVITETRVPMLRIHHLYDYVVSALGTTLYSHPTAKLWAEAEEALFRLRNRDPLQQQLIKTIALLQIIGEQTRVAPSKDVLLFALTDEDITAHQVEAGIASLETASLITFRHFRRAYRLYEGSDLDIDARMRDARAYLSQNIDSIIVANKVGITPPVVARRHSFEFGTLRYFEVRYCRPEDARDAISAEIGQADGLLLLCLARDIQELQHSAQDLERHLHNRPNVIVGLNVETEALHEAAVAVACLEWVQEETPELRNDRVAAREVRERYQDALHAFETEWDRLLRPNGKLEGGHWFYQGQREELEFYRQLQVLVSRACDNAFPHTPRLLNELVNRRQLSSTAAAARRDLIEGMIEHRFEPRFRIDGFPAEYSMYTSILEVTGIHRQAEDGTWNLSPPSDRDPALVRIWQEIDEFLFGGLLEPKPMVDLYGRLRSRPFGLTEGVIPVLICAFVLQHEQEIAVYEDGRFVAELDTATFERLIKRPGDFKIQGCRIAGERQRVLERFARGLLRPTEEPTLVNVVRQLYRVINRLPEYTVRTRNLSPEARALRDVFKESREPEQLLFVDLPRLLGARPFVEYESDAENANSFFEHWNQTMPDLVGAYPRLLERIAHGLSRAFDMKDWEELRVRATAIQSYISETKLRAFAARAADTTLTRDLWLESVASGVSGRPPFAWSDAEEDRFYNLLSPIVSAFQHSELLMFERQQVHDGDQVGMRVAVTMETGDEDARVVFTSRTDTDHIKTLAEDVRRAIESILKDQPADIRLTILGQITKDLLRGDKHE